MKKLVTICMILIFMLILTACGSDESHSPIFNVDLKTILRGPYSTDIDNQFNAIQRPDGKIVVFTGNGNARASVGDTVLAAASVQGDIVVGYGDGILYWLNHTEVLDDGRTLGFFHSESDMDYNNNYQTHKSMNIAFSPDYGQTWTAPQLVITSPDPATMGLPTGEGDCTMIDGQDGFFYAYCLRVRDYTTIVARADKSNPLVWFKYFNGSFSEPGLGGRADALGYVGTNVSSRNGVFFMLQSNGFTVTLFSSVDKIHFVPVQALFTDSNQVAYPSLVDEVTGSNVLTGTEALLFYNSYYPSGGFLSVRKVHVNENSSCSPDSSCSSLGHKRSKTF